MQSSVTGWNTDTLVIAPCMNAVAVGWGHCRRRGLGGRGGAVARAGVEGRLLVGAPGGRGERRAPSATAARIVLVRAMTPLTV